MALAGILLGLATPAAALPVVPDFLRGRSALLLQELEDELIAGDRELARARRAPGGLGGAGAGGLAPLAATAAALLRDRGRNFCGLAASSLALAGGGAATDSEFPEGLVDLLDRAQHIRLTPVGRTAGAIHIGLGVLTQTVRGAADIRQQRLGAGRVAGRQGRFRLMQGLEDPCDLLELRAVRPRKPPHQHP